MATEISTEKGTLRGAKVGRKNRQKPEEKKRGKKGLHKVEVPKLSGRGKSWGQNVGTKNFGAHNAMSVKLYSCTAV